MGRYQSGFVYKAFGAYHVKYRVTELQHGKPVRVQKSHRLCGDEFTKTQAKQKADEFMRGINLLAGTAQGEDVLVSEFWEQTYLPHLKLTKKASTLNGYLKLWNYHILPVFGASRLREVTCPRATIFLTSLVKDKKLGRRSVAHVHSLGSGMFRHAKQLGLVEQNPFTDAQSHVPPKKPSATHAYSLDEAETIFNALTGHPAEQLVFVLATFMGLRPGEISALKWDDIDDSFIHIRRASWRGVVGETKTEESVASVPLIEPIRGMFSAWSVQCLPSAGHWVFPNRTGDPMEMSGFARRQIVPVLAKKNIRWHGLYAGRRAAGSLLTQLTGDAIAAQYVLRHSNLATTTAFYVKPSREEAVTGMGLVESRLQEKFKFTPLLLQPSE